MFSRTLVMVNILKSVFTPTLNGIVGNGWYMSSTSIVKHARLTDWFQHMQKKGNEKRRKLTTVTTCSEKEHKHGNLVASFECARVDKLIIYISMCMEKAPIYKLSHNSVPKHSIFRLTDMREKPTDFFYSTARASTLAPAMILHKFPFLLRYIIP